MMLSETETEHLLKVLGLHVRHTRSKLSVDLRRRLEAESPYSQLASAQVPASARNGRP